MRRRLTKLRISLRRSEFAGLAIVIALFQFSLAIILLVIGIFLSEALESKQAILLCCGTWTLSLGAIIFMTGPRRRRTNDTGLGIFHILPVAMFLAALPSMIGNLEHLSYMMGFVDFIILMAMLVYGLICLRNLRWPSPGYWVYLVLNFLVLSRLR